MAQERIQNRPDECHKSCKSTVTRPKKAASSAQVSRFRRPEISASFVSVLFPAVNNDKANAPDRFAICTGKRDDSRYPASIQQTVDNTPGSQSITARPVEGKIPEGITRLSASLWETQAIGCRAMSRS